MEAIIELACGPVKTLTETWGQRSRGPLAASLWGFSLHIYMLHTESQSWNKGRIRALEAVGGNTQVFICVHVCVFL